MNKPKIANFAYATTYRKASLVFWSADVMQVDPVDLRQSFAKHLPRFEHLIPKPSKPKAALTRAVNRCSAGLPDGYLWRSIGDIGCERIVAYVEETVDKDRKHYSATDLLTVSVDESGIFTSKHTDDAETAAQIKRLRERYQVEIGSLTHQDLAKLMKAIILDACKGIRVKRGAATYIVPVATDDAIEGLAKSMACAGVSVVSIPLFDEEVLAQFTEDARHSLLDDAKSMLNEATERLAKIDPTAKSGQRVSTFQKRIEDAQALREKAGLYKMLLGAAVDDVEKTLKATEDTVRECMISLMR